MDDQVSVDDAIWRSGIDTAGCYEFKTRLLKDVILGAIALCCVVTFVNWPQPWVVVAGVGVVISVAWLSESRPVSRQLWPMSGRAVVITGCDTGIGHLLAKHLDNMGAVVFAGCLHSDGLAAKKLKEGGSKRLHILQMDVTSDSQVKECTEYVNKVLGGSGLWGLVNNAGLSMLGDVELTTMRQFSNLVNINQLGMVRVTKAFLPAIRRRKGRIVNITSVRGLIAEPFTGAYAMTKFATEAFSDILRLEMKKFGVSVSIIEPSNFGGATESINMNRIRRDFEEMWLELDSSLKSDYGREYLDFHINHTESTRHLTSFDLMRVIDAITHALFAVNSRSRYFVPGGCGRIDLYRWKALLQPFLPTQLMDGLLMHMYSRFPKPAVVQKSSSVD